MSAGSADRPLPLLRRLGAALVAPQRALEAAAAMPGRTPGDAALLMLIYFATVHMNDTAVALWLFRGGELGHGAMHLASHMANALKGPLLFAFLSGALLTIANGRRRSFGGDFDLASVALVPLLTVHAFANLLVMWGVVPLSKPFGYVVNGVAYAWAALLLLFAWRKARQRQPVEVKA